MVGIVTHDDVIDVLQQEATEDLQRQAAVGPIEGSYVEARFWTVWWSRAKWLVLLFALQTITVYVMDHYQERIAVSAALLACLPLVLSVGGNAGSQAATLVVRALALDEVKVGQWYRVLGREVLMGTALAGTLGLLALGRTWFLTPGHLTAAGGILEKLTIVLALSVAAICLWGTMLGSLLPLFFRRMGFDPALISSPAIATLSDVSGIAIYATIAAAIFF
jgi:magnesium transporter